MHVSTNRSKSTPFYLHIYLKFIFNFILRCLENVRPSRVHVANRLAEVHGNAWKDSQGRGSKGRDATCTRAIVWP